MIQIERIQRLNDHDTQTGRYVLYWMQTSQRSRYNHVLEYAIGEANRLKLPVVVVFGLTGSYPHANARHYHFMLEGLRETQADLERRGIQMMVQVGSPEKIAVKTARHAALVVTDRGYLRFQKQWRHVIAQQVKCPAVQVETDVVVPIETASAKEEYAAATLRPKIMRQLNDFLIPMRAGRVKKDSLGLSFKSLKLDKPASLIKQLKIDASVEPVEYLHGGYKAAKKHLRQFVRNKLDDYEDLSSDPMAGVESNLSPYLHFGQISPVEIALAVQRSGSKGTDAFLEQLIVRRELAMNFVHYNRYYDSFTCLPAWAKTVLNFHKKDKRLYVYTLKQLESAQTHDSYWNAAQNQMIVTGKMHNYLRMYWGKKILEWTRSPQKAFEIAVYLNDKYELDGRDPNGYAGVAWCFGKHDRPWSRRAIFGTVRYMNDKGLRRKFDADAYVRKWGDIQPIIA